MELATEDVNETAFVGYGRELRAAALDPRLRSYFLLYYGLGCRRFGREDEGVKWINEAREFAAAHKINQVAFHAERSLAESERTRAVVEKASAWPDAIPADVLEVASAIAHMCEQALSPHSIVS
jgi:hypothetical protein